MLKFWIIAIPIIFCLVVTIGTYLRISYNFKQKELKISFREVIKSIISGLLAASLVIFVEALIFQTYLHDNLCFYEDKSGGKLLLIILSFFLILLSIILFTARKSDEVLKVFWFLLILTLFFYFILVGFVEVIFIEKNLKNVDYSVSNVETIYLEPLNVDTDTKKNTYIEIYSNPNKEIHYVTKKENNSLSFDKMAYDKNFCDIFEDDLEIPRIEIITYSRQLFDIDNDVIAKDSYEEYQIFIPIEGYRNN